MRMKKIICFFLVAVIFSLTCSFAFANNFDGAYTLVNNNGAEALIPCQDVYVPSIQYANSSAWAMTTNSSSSVQYAQVGWSKQYPQSRPYLFWQWSSSSTQWDSKDFTPATIGQYYDCKVGCDASTMYFIVDNVTYKTLSLTSLSWPRNCVQFMGETNNVNCQCPGRISNKVLFSNMKYKDTTNIWQSGPVLTKRVTGSNMGNTLYSSSFYIWDTRYN